MRFFGHRVRSDGSPWGNFPGEISSDVKTRADGVRIKHRSNGNSLKLYDKGSVLGLKLRFTKSGHDPPSEAAWPNGCQTSNGRTLDILPTCQYIDTCQLLDTLPR